MPISNAKSSPPSIRPEIRVDARLISSQRSSATADSIATIRSTVPGLTSWISSCSRSSTSTCRTALADSVLASTAPLSPFCTAAARSSRVSPLWMLLTRTCTVLPASASLGTAAPTRPRARSFSSGSTDSSRSRQRTSALRPPALSSNSWRPPGTNRWDRYSTLLPR